MPDIRETDLNYSQELDQIMGYVPSTVVRNGIIVVFSVLCGLILLSYFLKYPEVVSTPVVLTTVHAPAPLVSKTSGRIESWFVVDGEIVGKDDYVALLTSTTDYDDIRLIDSKLSSFSGDWQTDIQRISFPPDVALGSLQDRYLNFYAAFYHLKDYITDNRLPNEIANKEKLLALTKQQYEIGLKQRSLRIEQFRIAQKFFSQDSTLFVQNKFGIPQREFDMSVQNLLQQKENLLAFDAALKTVETSLVTMQDEIQKLRLDHAASLNESIQSMHQSKALLKSGIMSWIETYLLASPIKGKVTFTSFWSANQVVTSGQRLATIVPLEETVIVGRAFIPSSGLGKVQEGQEVNIKLSGFPFLQFGVLEGRVKTVSLVPDEKGYVVEISLANGMMSNNREELKFVQEMDGIAEITTKDARLIGRIFNL